MTVGIYSNLDTDGMRLRPTRTSWWFVRQYGVFVYCDCEGMVRSISQISVYHVCFPAKRPALDEVVKGL